MLNKLFRLFRSTPTAPPQPVDVPDSKPLDPQPGAPPPPTADAGRTPRERDDAAWERYDDRVTAENYSWTYDGMTVTYRDDSWQYHEPDTYRPKALSSRFYNELSPEHVNELLGKWAAATHKGRVREHLERAAQVAYMRRKYSEEARSLANLLTRQCIQVYPERCSWGIFEWRAKLLAEQDLTADAVELLTKHSESCQD